MALRIRTLVAALAVAAVALTAAPAAGAAETCTKVAAPTGSDTAAGTLAAPYKTAQKLVDSLSAGQTGCLRAGTYAQNLKISRGGSSDISRVTLRNYPGEKATVKGRFWIAQGANYVTVENLFLDGTNSTNMPSPTVNAHYAVFRRNDVTNNHTAICFNLGHTTYGHANFTLIERNRIHHCGILPAANHDHGIYVSRADDTTIRSNWIYENADRGIQLYPNAQRTSITGNVIDSNGQGIIFGGLGGDSSDHSRVEGNVITNSKLRYNVESHYSDGVPPGEDNVVTRNCVKGGARDDGNGGIDPSYEGFTAIANATSTAPAFADRAAGDYRLAAGTTCAALVPDSSSVPGPQLTSADPEPEPTPTPTPDPEPEPTPTPTPDPEPTPTPEPTPPPTTEPTPTKPKPKPHPRRQLEIKLRVWVGEQVQAATSRRRARVAVSGRVVGPTASKGQRIRVAVRVNGRWKAIGTAVVDGNGRFKLVRALRIGRGAGELSARATTANGGRALMTVALPR
jgi:parallel beta-helix repeat protein